MSSTNHKFVIRFKFPELQDHKRLVEELANMDLEFVEENDYYVWEVKHPNWSVHYGSETGTTYLDYVVDEAEFSTSFGGVVSEERMQQVGEELSEALQNSKEGRVRLVAYGYYNGTDEPEIWEE